MTATVRPVARRVRKKTSKLAVARVVVMIAALFPGFVAVASASEIPSGTRWLGALLWFLSLMPAYFYLSSKPGKRRPLPFIQAISALFGLYYALPIALGEANRAWKIVVDPRDGYDLPMQLAFFGWIAMMCAYVLAAHMFHRRKPPREIPWKPRVLAKWGVALLLTGLAINAFRTIFSNAAAIGGFLQFFVSLQWLGLGLLVVLARRKELTKGARATMILGFIAAVGVGMAQGNVLPIVMLCIVVVFSLWAGRPQIEARWFLAAALSLLMAITIRGVIKDFRLTAWYGTQQFTQTESAKLMIKLLADRIAAEGISGAISGGMQQTAQRSANMDLFADVVRRTPSEIPYWNGETYYSLIGAAVPRFLWPGKPSKVLGQAFGHRYRYLDPTNLSTAINLPIIVELFANFGATAVIVGMLIVGALYGFLDSSLNRPGQSLLVTMFGLTLLLPLLVIESDFSLVFGGLPLSGLALWAVWVAMRKTATGPEKRGARARATITGSGPQLQPGSDRPILPAS